MAMLITQDKVAGRGVGDGRGLQEATLNSVSTNTTKRKSQNLRLKLLILVHEVNFLSLGKHTMTVIYATGYKS